MLPQELVFTVDGEQAQSTATTSRILPLAHYCHRSESRLTKPALAYQALSAILTHIDSFTGFGSLPHHLVEPILQQCSAEALERFEENTPALASLTQDCWRNLCERQFTQDVASILAGDRSPPDDWRSYYFTLQARQQQRFEELGSKIRGQRQEAEDRKKERQIVYTDPVIRRGRGGVGRPSTLIEKTRKESMKIQRSVYGSSRSPFLTPAKPARPRPETRPVKPPPIAGMGMMSMPRPAKIARTEPTPPSGSSASPPPPQSSPPPFSPALSLSPTKIKRDPMSSLFMPKHKAHSQRPVPVAVKKS
ncbi:hypothetical protein SISSUDRAFT_1118789 [Sistotremastrum suecicum HHB10207 ss-3]|uniref:Elongin-A n=1 Tax=Sistotremastrum suecicum HHB10207 ss-3 TaxID=1314776 RepID=A0A166ELI8_9AGAM|nr:hypothetical protein SISSUDRAFT_1118789 [Sistotremastrum suecicum HHB10207 ss-3]